MNIIPYVTYISCHVKLVSILNTAAVTEWVRARDTLIMFEATVCGRS